MPEKCSSGCLRHHPVTGQWVGRSLLPTKGQVGALHNGRDALLRCTGGNACGDKRRPEGEPPYGAGALNRPYGLGVLPWSAAEQMPLGYDVPSARRCRAARPPLGGGCRRSRLRERKPCGISPSASASRCHLPRRGRQGESVSPCAAGHMGPALRPPIFATGWVHRQAEIRKAARTGCFSYSSLWDQ